MAARATNVALLGFAIAGFVPWKSVIARRGLLGVAAGAGYVAVEGASALRSLPGSRRRATGSYELSSGAPTGCRRRRGCSTTSPRPTRRRGTSPCGSSGRAGARLSALLPPGRTGTAEVTSATGYRRRLPLTDDLLLAVDVGSEPLSSGHGSPVRLVVPGRRGFHWVKWVDRVEIDDRPWWFESPFPLQ